MAEVKVKITAQNEVRTGLQQALQETQKFSQQAKAAVSNTMTINPFEGDDRLGPLRDLQRQARALREQAAAPVEALSIPTQGLEITRTESRRAATAIRGLAADLANVSTPGQAFEAVLSRIGQVMGRLTGLVVGFAIGKVIAAQFDKLNAGLENAIANASRFSSAFQSMGNATNLGEAISQFRQLKTAADQTGETLRNLQNDLGATLANIALGGGFKSGGVFGELAALEEAQRRAAGAKLVNSTQFLLGQSEQRLEVAGNTEAEQEFERRAKQEQELFALQQELDSARAKGDGQLALDLQNAINLTRQRFEIEDQIAAKRKEAAAERQERNFANSAAQQRAANEDRGRSLEEKLARERQALADLDQFGGAGIELLREQTLAKILTLEEQITAERERQEQQAESAAKSLESAIEQREFAGLSPEEQQAKIEADQAALIAGVESGDISPAEAAQRALELANRQQALDGGGATGSFGASSLQRIGFASNEFFDTRQNKDPAEETRRAAEFIKQILDIIKKGEPLVLPSTN